MMKKWNVSEPLKEGDVTCPTHSFEREEGNLFVAFCL